MIAQLPASPDLKVIIQLYEKEKGGIKNDIDNGWCPFILNVAGHNFDSRVYFCDKNIIKAGMKFCGYVLFIDSINAKLYFALGSEFLLTIPRVVGEGIVIEKY